MASTTQSVSFILFFWFIDVMYSRPNFVIILLDDQDIYLDSPSYMPNLQSLIVNEGMTFKNAFVATPVCCPSRTEFISGRYYHNIGAPNGDCMFIDATKYVFDENSLFNMLYKNGYKTGVFGKLTNKDGSYFCGSPLNVTTAGMTRVYSMCNQGDFYNTKYINYTEGESTKHYKYTNLSYNDPGTYQGSQIGNKSIEFIEGNLKANNNFIAYIGFHEPHIQYTPAAWFANAFPNVTAPRTPNFNYQASNHMPWLNEQPALNETNINDIDKIYRDRLASTLQVDVTIGDVYTLLNQYKQLDNTYIIYFSDHGYHLGQWRIPCEKYQMFDTDIRIPYYIRGPNITSASSVDFIVGNVDVMPTVLDLADIPIPQTVDGKSFKSKILQNEIIENELNDNNIADDWRDVFLVEFLSPFHQYFNICSTWTEVNNDFHGKDVRPSPYTTNGSLVVVNVGLHYNPGNNYREIRIINSTHNWSYAEYLNYTFTQNDKENPYLHVLYDLNNDPWQLTNTYDKINTNIQAQLHQMLMQYGACQGQTCP